MKRLDNKVLENIVCNNNLLLFHQEQNISNILHKIWIQSALQTELSYIGDHLFRLVTVGSGFGLDWLICLECLHQLPSALSPHYQVPVRQSLNADQVRSGQARPAGEPVQGPGPPPLPPSITSRPFYPSSSFPDQLRLFFFFLIPPVQLLPSPAIPGHSLLNFILAGMNVAVEIVSVVVNSPCVLTRFLMCSVLGSAVALLVPNSHHSCDVQSLSSLTSGSRSMLTSSRSSSSPRRPR